MPPQPLPWKDATDVGRGKAKAPRLAPLTTAAALTGLAAGAATGAATLAVCVPVLGGEIHGNLGGWFQETMALWGTIDAKTERDTKIISKTSRRVLFFSVLHYISYHIILCYIIVYLHHYIFYKYNIRLWGDLNLSLSNPRWHPHQDHHGCCRGIFAAPLPSKVAASGPSDVWQLSVGTAYGHGDFRLEREKSRWMAWWCSKSWGRFFFVLLVGGGVFLLLKS